MSLALFLRAKLIKATLLYIIKRANHSLHAFYLIRVLLHALLDTETALASWLFVLTSFLFVFTALTYNVVQTVAIYTTGLSLPRDQSDQELYCIVGK